VDVVAQGLELKPVTGPIKNVTLWMLITFSIFLIGAKLAMDLAASARMRKIAVGAIVVSFLLFVDALLLQWNRSLLWHRALFEGKRRHQGQLVRPMLSESRAFAGGR
jgi:hypothetical protein